MGFYMGLNSGALIMDGNFHLLDHIAPLASLLKIPLLANDEETARIANLYYPEVETRLYPDIEFKLKDIAAEFDLLFNCQYWGPSFKDCLRSVFNKDVKLVFCPHGQSDKGYKSPTLALYEFQDAVLLYGDLLQEMLVELNIWPRVKGHARVGNYRQVYHELYKQREAKFAEEEIFAKLDLSRKTLLYAPTWKDADHATSFFAEGERVIRELPSDWNLIIKLHPLLIERNPALCYRLSALEEKRPNFLVVHEFPLVYAMLERIDAYLGDYSSIGYDVLSFRKPMFFWQSPELPPARLHSCGQIVDRSQNVFTQIERGMEKAQDFMPLQEALYNHSFDVAPNLSLLIQSLTGGST